MLNAPSVIIVHVLVWREADGAQSQPKETQRERSRKSNRGGRMQDGDHGGIVCTEHTTSFAYVLRDGRSQAGTPPSYIEPLFRN